MLILRDRYSKTGEYFVCYAFCSHKVDIYLADIFATFVAKRQLQY